MTRPSVLYPLYVLSAFITGWLGANHWTHGTPLWWAVLPLAIGLICAWIVAKQMKPVKLTVGNPACAFVASLYVLITYAVPFVMWLCGTTIVITSNTWMAFMPALVVCVVLWLLERLRPDITFSS